jgi:glycosyltransferase involved in cell wall biosynthesis
VKRDRDLLFVGRLVSSKGADILLEAVGQLRSPGPEPKVTIVGDGPELPRLQAQAARLGLLDRIEFTGSKSGAELSRIFNAHRILVVPSVAPETFGIVALEGIACGCVVVASSEAGGLHEALGDCGFTFETGNASALASCLAGLLHAPDAARICVQKAERHVAAFSARTIAEAYLRVINRAFGAVAVATQSCQFSVCVGVASFVELAA